MPRCNYCLDYSEKMVYKDGIVPPLCCEDCAQNIDKVESFLNTFNPEDYDEESESWKE